LRTYANKSAKAKGVLATMYFNTEQIREIIHDAGDIGYLLMSFYVGIGSQTSPNLEDAHLAKMLNKSVKTIEKTRLALTKAGWFKRTTAIVHGEKHIMYAIGKDAVANPAMNFSAVIGVRKQTK